MPMDPTPREEVDITSPGAISESINTFDGQDSPDALLRTLVDLGYAEDDTLDPAHELTTFVVMGDSLYALSLSQNHTYRLTRWADRDELCSSDTLLTIHARMKFMRYAALSKRALKILRIAADPKTRAEVMRRNRQRVREIIEDIFRGDKAGQ